MFRVNLSHTFFSCFLLLGLFFTGCKNNPKEKSALKNPETTPVVSDELPWADRMALSEMVRFPDPKLLDFREKPKWSYTPGLVLQAISKVHTQRPNPKYMDYIKDYAFEMVHEDGHIETYKLSNYNLDMIKSGDILYYLYEEGKDPRYKMAMDTLHKQLEGQPTTSEGGYWHKKIYPYQMWLDGVYMAEPFHTKYALSFMEGPEAQKTLDKIMLQFDLIEKHNKDPKTGLYYHGWDESKEQRWANPETGLSANFWSRGMGWYGMALVDVLELLPETHPARERLLEYLKGYADAILPYQHSSGTWYQVMDQGDREGNYLEATSTAMFTYTLAKAVNNNFLPKEYKEYATKAYDGMLEQFVTVEDNGLVNLNQCCAVAGLGGNPYRDGSYEYYINEKIRSNDPKGTGPFIMASLELNK